MKIVLRVEFYTGLIQDIYCWKKSVEILTHYTNSGIKYLLATIRKSKNRLCNYA